MNALERFGERLSSTAWQVPARYTAAAAFARLRAVIADDRARCRGGWVRSKYGFVTRDGWRRPVPAYRWSWGLDGRPVPRAWPPNGGWPSFDEEALSADWTAAISAEHRALIREKNELAARFVSRLDSLTMPTRGNRRGI